MLATVGPLFVLLGFAAASCLVIADSTLPSLKAERWVNSPALTPVALRGKVVLVDFWEYTCVNWIRTAPYVKAWNREYASFGLVVIGVHCAVLQQSMVRRTQARQFHVTRPPPPDQLSDDDWRKTNPRFTGENFHRNLRMVDEVQAVAREVGATPAQIALAWLLAQGDDIAPIPGAKRVARSRRTPPPTGST